MSESEIKWLPLRLNVLPLIDKQAKAVLQLYLATRKEIVDGDILSIQKLITIKQEVLLPPCRSPLVSNRSMPSTLKVPLMNGQNIYTPLARCSPR
jgi:hypothetical protein